MERIENLLIKEHGIYASPYVVNGRSLKYNRQNDCIIGLQR